MHTPPEDDSVGVFWGDSATRQRTCILRAANVDDGATEPWLWHADFALSPW